MVAGFSSLCGGGGPVVETLDLLDLERNKSERISNAQLQVR